MTIAELESKIREKRRLIEKVESDIYQLEMKKDQLNSEIEGFRKQIKKIQSKQSYRDWETGQRMTLNLLRDYVGGDVIDI